jgi:CRP/FNR family transcriptional regulator, cyclic AMP receptor protein
MDADLYIDDLETETDDYSLLGNLSEEEWARFIEYTETCNYHAGDLIVQQNQIERVVHILTDGEVEVFVTDEQINRRQRIATIEEGSVFGEQSFIDGQPRSASIVALTDCCVLSLSLEAFQELQSDEPEIACAFLFDTARILSLRLRGRSAIKLK